MKRSLQFPAETRLGRGIVSWKLIEGSSHRHEKAAHLVSLTTNDNDYQIEQAQSAEQAARKLGVELQIVYADNDAITQSTQILKAIQADENQRPNAIVFEPVGGTALPQVARAAATAGIGWAVLNRDASYIPELRRSSPVRFRCDLRPP